MPPTPPEARWIWHPDAQEPNLTVTFLGRFARPEGSGALRIQVTAVSRYRLWLNGEWLADGPARAWPDHYVYEEIALNPEKLRDGNVLEVRVTHWGADNFQYIDGEAGLLLAVRHGEQTVCATGPDWQTAIAREYPSRTPRFGCQLAFEEVCDTRMAGKEHRDYRPAAIRPGPSGDLFRDLHLVRTPPLTRVPLPFHLLQRTLPLPPCTVLSLPKDECFKPDPSNANIQPSPGVWCATLTLDSPRLQHITTSFGQDELWIDGREVHPVREAWVDGMKQYKIDLEAGEHFLALRTYSESNINEVSLAFRPPIPPLPLHVTPRVPIGSPAPPSHRELCRRTRLGNAVQEAGLLPVAPLQPSPSFHVRVSLPPANAALPAETPVPGGTGPVLWRLDLGHLSVGYPSIDVEAPSGTVIEGYLVEHIEPPGAAEEWIHHMANKQNGFRVICSEGVTRWTAKERRGGRYLFLLVHGDESRISFHRIEMIESTYPAVLHAPGGGPRFCCSDPVLDRMHLMSLRTLQLCMEDTFTDCPTYEQVTWIGDTRNEALFNFYSFGTADIVERGLELGAQSLDTGDLVRSMVPNRIDFIIPAWSFLWGIEVWETYWHTGDTALLARLFPSVCLNLERAAARIRDNGLFEGPGMFDWAPIDHNHPFVTHNQMFFILALENGARAAETLHEPGKAAHFRELADGLRAAVLRHLWVPERGAFADSLHGDGSLSPKSCLHTFALALLSGVLPEGDASPLLAALLNPREGFANFGSPFAKFYMLEALMGQGRNEEAMDALHAYWVQMMPEWATTFWEMVEEEWLRGESPKATRSHCHGWSAAPLYLFGRILLGIEVLEPGFRSVRIHPTPWRLTHARGVVHTPLGELKVSWTLGPDGQPEVDVVAPEGMRVLPTP